MKKEPLAVLPGETAVHVNGIDRNENGISDSKLGAGDVNYRGVHADFSQNRERFFSVIGIQLFWKKYAFQHTEDISRQMGQTRTAIVSSCA